MARRRSKAGIHAHGCTDCGRRYEDACESPDNPRKPGPDALCSECRTGRPMPWWPEAREPRDCCRAHSRQTRKNEDASYKLAGSGPWFICPVCCRTFPFRNPAWNRSST